jgi:GT2 family glycosyltransferase
MSSRVSAVVVNYEQRELLRSCLESLREALRRIGDGCEVIVVDNGSADGSGEMVREAFPEMRLIELSTNTGFAGGMSTGVRHASGEWILSINNDATVSPETVEELLRVAEAHGADLGAVAARMVFADRPDVINSAGILVDRLGVASDRLLGEKVAASEREPVEVFGVSAGAALYRAAMLDEVPFEPTFFAYYEDVDVAWRARMRGWRCTYAPGAVVRHHHSATSRHGSAFKYYWSGRNRVRVLARNATGSQLCRYGLAMLLFDLAYIATVLAAERSVAPVRGRLDGLRTWRSDRRGGVAQRSAIELAPFLGVRAAYRRFRGGQAPDGER